MLYSQYFTDDLKNRADIVRISALIVFLITSTMSSLSQEKPKAILLDEFGAVGCETYSSRLENLFVNLNANPNARGFVVINGRGSDIRKKLKYELWLFGRIMTYNFDRSRITEIRGPEAGGIKIQLWLVPAGSDPPKLAHAAWDFRLPTDTKPFVFYAESSDTLCSSGGFDRLYVEFLQANRGVHGNIVIYARSVREFEKQRVEIIKALSDVDVKRIRFVFRKPKYGVEPDVEWWIVPESKT